MIRYHYERATLTALKPSIEQHLQSLEGRIAQYRANPLPHFQTPKPTPEDNALDDHAQNLRAQCARVIVLGTGGASLSGQVFAQIASQFSTDSPQLIFADNLDAQSFAALIAPDQLTEQGFIVISKSGATIETIAQICLVVDALAQNNIPPAERVTIITERNGNMLHRLATAHRLRIFDHNDKIGGRYSALTNVGLLPARIAGLDIDALRLGAQSTIDALLTQADTLHPASLGAAVQMAQLQAGRAITVLMPYADRLERFGAWVAQLTGESLGKKGQGITPIIALGPVDQHSQMQLYADGPDDKFYTFITIAKTAKDALRVPATMVDGEHAQLAGRNISEIVAAQARAAMDTLVRLDRPLRHIALPALNAEAIGALMMNYMIETILIADLLGINAFDQPGVDHAKTLTRDYLMEYKGNK